MSSSSRDRKKQIHQFCSITGATKDTAKQVLKACNFNVEMAINMHVESVDSGSEHANSSGNATVDPRTPSDSPEATVLPAGLPPDPLPGNEDDVRAPIAPIQGVLVQGGFSAGFRSRRRISRSVFDGFRDFQAETREQEQQLWSTSSRPTRGRKQKTLEDLFRPPLDLMHRGSFESARKVGQCSNKWLLVNIQNVQEFPCQVLNRDVWSNPAVKAVIQEHFVFWQVYHDSEEGQRYTQFYKVLDWPYVGILDPRTGEMIIVWNKFDSSSFCDLVSEFLKSHPSLDGSFTACIEPPSKRLRSESILDASEDSQLEAAIKASLNEAIGGSTSKPAAVSGHGPTKSESGAASTSGDKCSPAPNHSAGRNEEEVVMVDEEEEEEDEIETFDSDSDDSVVVATPTVKQSSKKAQAPTESPATKLNDAHVLDWRLYLGADEETKSNINVRYPDGSKDQFTVPPSSKLQALLLYVQSKGFPKDGYELVTNFPRRLLSSLDSDMSMKDAGLYPQETVFVQSR